MCNFIAGDDSKKHDMFVFKSCMIVPLYSASRKHAYVIVTPLNPTFI